MKRLTPWTVQSCLLLLATPALAATSSYKGVDLYTIVSDSSPYVMINDISGGQVAGSTQDSVPQALLWTSPLVRPRTSP